MASLKRILLDVEEVDNSSDSQASRFSRHSSNVSGAVIDNEIPILPDQSWTELWGGLLNLDYNHGENSPSSNSVAVDKTSLDYTQEGIESWAARELLLSNAQSSQEPSPPTNLTHGNSAESIGGKLCYGMIYRVAIKLEKNMSELDTKLSEASGSQDVGLCVFGVQRDSTQFVLTFSNGTRLGFLNTRMANALQAIVDRPGVRLDAVVDVMTLRETIGRATKPSEAVVLVDVNVYGSKETRDKIGQKLSAKSVFLQRPDHPQHGSIYDNPHVITFPNLKASNAPQKAEEMSDNKSILDSTERFREAVTSVYASLKRGSGLKRLEGDDRLKTVLLPHQEEALDFMIQREVGPIPAEFRLWQPIEVNGHTWYLHAITQAKSRTQYPETGGGILADEMGMGKSLSIILLIIKTLGDAHDWQVNQDAAALSGITATKRSTRATLVIVPSALLINNWLEEIRRHLDDETLTTIKYHGQSRRAHLPLIVNADIVVTTIYTLATEFMASSDSPLHQRRWFRVVVDEAHVIRRQATSLYRAVFELNAKYRWCLTGTPIQNRLEDIGSLFAFIRARPFEAMSTFRKFIIAPFDESEERRVIASKRLAQLLDSVCLRRMKDLLALPDRLDKIRLVEFSREEWDQYERTKRILIRTIKHRAGESESRTMFGMFQAQLQLRILCNHGTFQPLFSWATRDLLAEREDALGSIGQSGEMNCQWCRQVVSIIGSSKVYRAGVENCGHVLCSECLEDCAENVSDDLGRSQQCPLCIPSGDSMVAMDIDPGASQRKGLHHNNFCAGGVSSKIEALMRDVRQDLMQTKSIVFSCWTRTLDLIGRHLELESIGFERIDGDCPLSRRQWILDSFATDSKTRVLIMTTGTGACGLSLTAANRVFIVEPQWNPSVESQAIARALRIGQGNSVLVTRYVTNRTVEQEMLSQQNRKIQIAQIGWG